MSSSSTYQPGSSGSGILGGAGSTSASTPSGSMGAGGASSTQQRSMWGGQQQSSQQQHPGSQGQGMFANLRHWMQCSIENSSDFMRRNVNQYPVLAGYLFTLMACSAVPVSIYTIFGLVSSLVLLSIALVGFAAIEGTILLASGGLLLTVLGTITFFTTIGFGFIAFTWFGYKSFRTVFGQVWQGAGYVTSTVGEKIQEAMPSAMSGQQQQQSGPYASQASR